MAIARAGIVCLCALSWLNPAWGNDDHYSELRQLDEQIQGLKQQALQLELDYQALQDSHLFPAQQQLRVFLTMEVFDFNLNAVELSADGVELAVHQYTPREVYALRKGGAQELYLGNVSPGVHSLQARFIGQFEDSSAADEVYEKTIEVSFRKSTKANWLELKIDRSRGKALTVRVFQRETSQ